MKFSDYVDYVLPRPIFAAIVWIFVAY